MLLLHGLLLFFLSGASPIAGQFFRVPDFGDFSQRVGELGHAVRTEAAQLYRSAAHRAGELVACPRGECCVPEFVIANVTGLHRNLTADLFGQHIVIDVLCRALQSHYSPTAVSDKPLVLSLHGTSGTGKTFVAQRLATHLFRHGVRSRFVHRFVGRLDFPLAERAPEYAARLLERIAGAVRECPAALFIFDELDKMPAGILDAVSGVLGSQELAGGVDYRRATFVFVSNAHGEEIAERLRSWQLEEGGLREQVRSVHFEQVLKLIAFNSGGLRGSTVVSEDLVDHYVAFLPLERQHVKQCVRRELQRRNDGAKAWEVDERLVDQIADEAATYNDKHFSISGCKRIDKAVAYHTSADFKQL